MSEFLPGTEQLSYARMQVTILSRIICLGEKSYCMFLLLAVKTLHAHREMWD